VLKILTLTLRPKLAMGSNELEWREKKTRDWWLLAQKEVMTKLDNDKTHLHEKVAS